MKITDDLQCLFSARVVQQGETHIIEIPEQELEIGSLAEEETYRVAVMSPADNNDTTTGEAEPTSAQYSQDPPVDEGERRIVEIEDIGEQGDGLARVERGFVVIVPETKQGERVTVEIDEVRENVAFADVVEREGYYG